MKKDKEMTAFNVRDIHVDMWERFKTVSQVLGYETLNDNFLKYIEDTASKWDDIKIGNQKLKDRKNGK
jgi:hypothetical protein